VLAEPYAVREPDNGFFSQSASGHTRGVRLKFYNHKDPTMAELVDEQDQTLFTAVLHNDDHVLRYILPDRRHHSYCLRPKRRELTLAIRRDSRNFFQRLLFKDMY